MYSLILRGRRSIELHNKWCDLNPFQNASAFSNSFSSASASANVRLQDARKRQNFSVSSLTDSLGLTSKLAESISRRVSFEEKGNPDSVPSLLRSHGFRESQISTMITIYPRLLVADAEKSIGPKLQFLQSRGASTSELTEIVSTVPKILGVKGDTTISRYYDLIKEIIEADKSSKFQKLCYSLAKGSKLENKIRNISVLRELGMPQKLLFSMLISDFSTGCGKEKFEESLKKVVELGFDSTSSRFVKALQIVYALSDKTIEEKVNVYKKLGFAEGDVWVMFRKYPRVLALSEKKILNSVDRFLGLGFSRDEFVVMVKCFPACIGYSTESLKKKTEFVVKNMDWPLKSVALFPAVLGYSMEKRIVPRCNVIKALLSKGLLHGSKVPSMSSIFACTDEAFVNRYVMMSDDKHLVLELMTILTERQTKNKS